MSSTSSAKRAASLRWVLALLALLVCGASVHAAVTQTIGFTDAAFNTLARPDCEKCHGAALADRHHATPNATSGKCYECHSVSAAGGKSGVALERNCTTCHKTSPHHETQAAKEKKCQSCHSSPGVGAYNAAMPSYKASKVTPSRTNCSACHAAGTVGGVKISSNQDTHHAASAIGCDACHDNDPSQKSFRSCEKCHDPVAIHQVEPHTQKGACGVCHKVQ